MSSIPSPSSLSANDIIESLSQDPQWETALQEAEEEARDILEEAVADLDIGSYAEAVVATNTVWHHLVTRIATNNQLSQQTEAQALEIEVLLAEEERRSREIADLEAEIVELDSVINDRDHELAKANDTISEMKKKLMEMKEQKKEAEERNRHLEEGNARLLSELEALQKRNRQLEGGEEGAMEE